MMNIISTTVYTLLFIANIYFALKGHPFNALVAVFMGVVGIMTDVWNFKKRGS